MIEKEQLTIRKYHENLRDLWELFIQDSINGLFLHNRKFLQYHQDRFVDHSLLFFYKKKLIAVFPAHHKEDELISHKGLSFGGLIWEEKMSIPLMTALTEKLIKYLKEQKVNRLYYKPVPSYYASQPNHEDLFALQPFGLQKIDDVPAFIIRGEQAIPYNSTFKRKLKNSRKYNLDCAQSEDFRTFYMILESLLKKKYNSKPVHSFDELNYLTQNFPQQIKLYTVHYEGRMLAGIIIFEYDQVAKAQYIASTSEGNEKNAMIFLIHALIHDFYPHKQFVDLGTSQNEDGTLNQNLAFFKTCAGARIFLQSDYELIID